MTDYRVSFEACRQVYDDESGRNERGPCELVTMDVPNDTVIREPNRIGRPVVWYYYDGGKVVIRCYLPGAGA